MSRSWTTPLLALAFAPAFYGCCPDSCSAGTDVAGTQPIETAKPSVGAGIASLNGFVENRGQWPEDVLFFARRGGIEATVLRDALVFRPTPACEDEPAPAPLILYLPGDATGRVIEGLDRHVTKHHFLLGDRRASEAAGFGRVALRDVLPGVDVVLRSDGGAFEYDLVLAPGASLDQFMVEVEGASALECRAPDALVLHTEAGEVEQRIQASWQGEEREAVACRFCVLEPADGKQRFGFEAPAWDRDLALVLDPDLVYLTYIGGPAQETLVEAVVDASGAFYLLGKTTGGTPVTPGCMQDTVQGLTSDAWIGKLSPDGSALAWATFLGGSETEDPRDFALDADGTAVVVGQTWSPDFPTTPGAYQTLLSHGTTKSDVFVSRLSATGTELLWSTFYGGTNHDAAWACAVYQESDVLVAFEPFLSDPPSTPGTLDVVFDSGDLGLFRLTSDGSQQLWQTYFRASTIDDLLIDSEGSAYLVGYISASDAPLVTTPGAFKEHMAPGDHDGYVTKMNPSGTQLIWSTYLGGDPNAGSGLDRVYAVDLDAAHAVYVAGTTQSETFPVTPGAFQSTLPGQSDGFAAKLLPNGSGLAWATYLGASGFAGATQMEGIGVDQSGCAIVFGHANEPDFPVTPDAFQPLFIGPLPSSGDTLLCKLDPVGEDLVYATWLGGTGTDYFCELAVDLFGDAYPAFRGGPDLPTTPFSYQGAYAGSGDLAAAKFDFDLDPWTILDGGLGGKDVPSLVGIGPLTTGSATRLSLRGAPPVSPAWLVAGIIELGVPLLGGTLVPFPTVVIPWLTGPLGDFDFTFPWPQAPAGSAVFFQVWTPDPQAPKGWSASHGLKAASQ